jgi:hypothetical protein
MVALLIQIREHIAEWMSPVDAFWAIQLIKNLNLSSGLEIGVYKGAWSASILDNIPTSKIVGVDPYPGLKHIEEVMRFEMSDFQSENRFKIYDCLEELDPEQKFDFVHIDGEHSEEALNHDLTVSFGRLSDCGFIVIDDFMNRIFPGVTSATLITAVKLDLKPILITEYKIYLVRSKDYVASMKVIDKINCDFDLGGSSQYDNGLYGESYSQDGKILGVNAFIQGRLSNWKIDQLLSRKLSTRRIVRSAMYFITPPLFRICTDKIIRIFRK